MSGYLENVMDNFFDVDVDFENVMHNLLICFKM